MEQTVLETGEASSPTTSNQEVLKARLTATDPHFRSLVEEHALFHGQLEQLEAKGDLTLADEEVEHRLKVRKLQLKDQIQSILLRVEQHA